MNIKVYVEGGGDHNKTLDSQCRRGFSSFIEKTGLDKRMPRIVACGGRQRAYDGFRVAHERRANNSFPILLVDSEAPISVVDPWTHVKQRPGDGWNRPQGASDDQLHFMVQAMEAWFYADKRALTEYFGQGFKVAALSQRKDIENIPKGDLLSGLAQATRHCEGKDEYSKGRHSFQILERLDPSQVRAASPCAERFLNLLDQMSKV